MKTQLRSELRLCVLKASPPFRALTASPDYTLEKVSPMHPPGKVASWGWKGRGAGPVQWGQLGTAAAPLSPTGGWACVPVLSLPQLRSQMVPGGGQSSKDLVPELQPLWFGGGGGGR